MDAASDDQRVAADRPRLRVDGAIPNREYAGGKGN
jgi:hypothetical protein